MLFSLKNQKVFREFQSTRLMISAAFKNLVKNKKSEKKICKIMENVKERKLISGRIKEIKTNIITQPHKRMSVLIRTFVFLKKKD